MAELLATLDSRMLDVSYKLEHAQSQEEVEHYSNELNQVEAELNEVLNLYWFGT